MLCLGKCFYLELDGEGKMPVFHFGMTGMVQVNWIVTLISGRNWWLWVLVAPSYRWKASFLHITRRDQNLRVRNGLLALSRFHGSYFSPTLGWTSAIWQFILHLTDDASNSTAELAFMDARRLGRIRLRASPLTELPISELGFDPILSMPTLDQFIPLVLKRSCPIKALLLDQSFSAGVGNWVAGRRTFITLIKSLLMCQQLQMRYCIMPEYTLSSVAIRYQVNNWLCFIIKHRVYVRLLLLPTQTTVNFPNIGYLNIDGCVYNVPFQKDADRKLQGRGKKEKHTLKLVKIIPLFRVRSF